jgi:hypothetical protein
MTEGKGGGMRFFLAGLNRGGTRPGDVTSKPRRPARRTAACLALGACRRGQRSQRSYRGPVLTPLATSL